MGHGSGDVALAPALPLASCVTLHKHTASLGLSFPFWKSKGLEWVTPGLSFSSELTRPCWMENGHLQHSLGSAVQQTCGESLNC